MNHVFAVAELISMQENAISTFAARSAQVEQKYEHLKTKLATAEIEMEAIRQANQQVDTILHVNNTKNQSTLLATQTATLQLKSATEHTKDQNEQLLNTVENNSNQEI
jgi:hypothetical protein